MLSSLITSSIYIFFSQSAKMSKNSQVPLAVYYVTAPNAEEATNLSKLLLDNKLIACCNIVNNVKSVYKWEGKVEDSSEVLMIMKSRQELLERITEFVIKHHSYDVPEVIAMPILGGS